MVVLVGGGGSFNQACLSDSSSISVVFIQYFRAHTQTNKLSPFWLKLETASTLVENLQLVEILKLVESRRHNGIKRKRMASKRNERVRDEVTGKDCSLGSQDEERIRPS